ncbi:MAG: DUF6531 domain-containing protein, partial [Rhodocyclaceae bacterium]
MTTLNTQAQSSPPPPAAPPQPARPAQVAVAPLNTIDVADVGQGAVRFDGWLRSVSGGLITLERLKQVAGAVPVVGNIIALVDVLGDVVKLVQSKGGELLDWVSLGINMIGVIPFPPGMAGARMGLRPALHLVRQELARAGPAALGDAIIEALVSHLNASIVGEIDDFVRGAQSRLQAMLDEAGQTCEAMLEALASGLGAVVLGELDAAGEARRSGEQLSAAGKHLVRDPKAAFGNFLAAAWGAYKAAAKATSNAVARALVPEQARESIAKAVADLRTLGGQVRQRLGRLGDAATALSIGWLLMQLAQAVQRWRARKRAHPQAANVSPSQTNEARRGAGAGTLESSAQQAPARQDPGCKNGVLSGTAHHISFATGSETLAHTDFVLPGLLPIVWTRTYCSRLAAYDEELLGARWITPYTTRLDTDADERRVRYHDAEGRTHSWPLPEVGGHHHDPIEVLTLVRVSATHLSVVQGLARQESYVRHGRHWRLLAISWRSGAKAIVHYEHRVQRGEHTDTVLSDILTYQGECLQSHIGTRLDAHGRVDGLWQIEAGRAVRQLAHYEYSEAGDLLIAQSEHGTHWTYAYQQHLLSRYTDRTGRGINLQWDGTSAQARATREWADDGSFDTRLEWDRAIRLTYVTDAAGHESWHYYDIDGYTYRIVHPDGLSEWLYRDAAKNITRHIHPDGSAEDYAYDALSQLLCHTRRDGSTEHYAWDEQQQLIKIRDAEGGLWQREYDARGNLTQQIDPLEQLTEYAYDTVGQLIEITDAKGGKQALAYTRHGQLASHTDCTGQRTTWQYDAAGQLTRHTDAAGQHTDYTY